MPRHAAVVLVVVAVMVAACGPTADSSATTPAGLIVPAVSPSAIPISATITPEATIAVADASALAFDGTTMWVISGTGTISRIDPVTNKIGAGSAIVEPRSNDGGFGANEAGIWVGNFDTNLVYRLDPASLTVVAKIPAGPNPDGVGAADNAVWVANHRGGSVTRIDPATNALLTIKTGNPGRGGPHQIGFGAGSVWVSAGISVTDTATVSAVVRIDPATNKVVATIPMPSNASACGGFAISREAVWMPSCADAPVLVRIDPAANTVVGTIDLGGYGGQPILVDGVLWLTVRKTDEGPDPARLVRIDPATNTVDRVVSLGETFRGEDLLAAFGSIWTIDWTKGDVLRLPLAAFKP